MARRAAGVVLAVLATVGLIAVATAQVKPGKEPNFDYYVFVRQWPGTFCGEGANPCPLVHHNGYRFTIHGLWPNYDDGRWPEYCDEDDGFDEKKIEGLLPEMEENWPSVKDSNEGFWEHEWKRHGTCAAKYLPTEHDYFKSVLKLHADLDIAAALKDAGITPSDAHSYSGKDISEAVKKAYGHGVVLHCDSEGRLTEVWMCMGTDLKPRECSDPVVVAAAPGGPRACSSVKIPSFGSRIEVPSALATASSKLEVEGSVEVLADGTVAAAEATTDDKQLGSDLDDAAPAEAFQSDDDDETDGGDAPAPADSATAEGAAPIEETTAEEELGSDSDDQAVDSAFVEAPPVGDAVDVDGNDDDDDPEVATDAEDIAEREAARAEAAAVTQAAGENKDDAFDPNDFNSADSDDDNTLGGSEEEEEQTPAAPVQEEDNDDNELGSDSDDDEARQFNSDDPPAIDSDDDDPDGVDHRSESEDDDDDDDDDNEDNQLGSDDDDDANQVNKNKDFDPNALESDDDDDAKGWADPNYKKPEVTTTSSDEDGAMTGTSFTSSSGSKEVVGTALFSGIFVVVALLAGTTVGVAIMRRIRGSASAAGAALESKPAGAVATSWPTSDGRKRQQAATGGRVGLDEDPELGRPLLPGAGK